MANADLDNGVDAAAAVLKPHTLAEVSGAVPQMPPCFVPRVQETLRLTEALTPAGGEALNDGEQANTLGGATTVIYDAVANGKRWVLLLRQRVCGASGKGVAPSRLVLQENLEHSVVFDSCFAPARRFLSLWFFRGSIWEVG